MKETKNRLDISLLITVATLTSLVYYWDLYDVFVISINDLLLIVLLVFALRKVLYNSVKGKYLLLILILLAVPGVLTTNFAFDGSGSTSAVILGLGNLKFNPLSVLILLIYLLINREGIIKVLTKSDEERTENSKKLIEFYYGKFGKLSEEDFNDALLIYDQYSEEAKSALDRVKSERKYDEFNKN